MATLKQSMSSLMGTVTKTADTLTSTVDTIATGVDMLNITARNARRNLILSNAGREVGHQHLLEAEIAGEITKAQLEIESWSNQDTRTAQLFAQNLAAVHTAIEEAKLSL